METENYDIPLHVSRRKAAKLLKCSLTTLDTLLATGELQSFRTGSTRTSKVNVSVNSIQRFIDKGGCFYKRASNMSFEQFLDNPEGM